MASAQTLEMTRIGLDDAPGRQISSEDARLLLGVLSMADNAERTYSRVVLSPPDGEQLYVKTRLFG